MELSLCWVYMYCVKHKDHTLIIFVRFINQILLDVTLFLPVVINLKINEVDCYYYFILNRVFLTRFVYIHVHCNGRL